MGGNILKKKYTHLSLFAGCGGIDLGFKFFERRAHIARHL
jgi:site-specific DNA-cytosine methylase